MSQRDVREQIAMHGESLFHRGLTCGSSGNISVRVPDGLLITPTNSCLGRIDPDRISKISSSGRLISGDKPSKELFLHLAMYRMRPQDQAIVHLHSTWSVAVSCLENLDPTEVLPPITAYYLMRVGSCPLIPFFPPGDEQLASQIEQAARQSRAMLLANHGPVVSGIDLESAVCSIEELEETAKLFMLLKDKNARFLTPEQCATVRERFPT